MTVNRIIFQHISKIVELHLRRIVSVICKQIINADNLNIFAEVFHCGAEYHPSDTAESIDTDSNHNQLLLE